jgi:hypothetical protein
MLRDSRRTFCITLFALIAAACSDGVNMVSPHAVAAPSGPRVSRTTLACTATLHPQMVVCKPAAAGGGSAATAASSPIRKNIIVGKQNVYVFLNLTNFAYSNTNVFSFNATVQNLMTQPIGTQNGTAVAGGGVDVFFTNGPFVACGTGTVSAVGTSTGTFTASGQQYYQYNQIIKPDSTSAIKTWSFQLSPSVCGFNFYVEVSGDLPAEGSVLRWTVAHQGVTPNQLNGVWQDNANDVFAAGLGGTVLHYNGTTWSQLALNQPTYQLRAVSGSSTSDVWFVGDAGITTHYNGTSFTTVATSSADNLTGVWDISATNIYAVGYPTGTTNSIIFHSTNGTSWTAVTPPHGVTDSLFAVWAADANDIFMVGHNGRILYDSSGTFVQFTRPTTSDLRAVWGTSATNVYAVGDNGVIYHFTGGATWTAMTSNTTNNLAAIGGTSASNIWAVGAGGTTVNYNGSAWSVVGPAIGLNLHGVTSSNVSPVWAVGDAGTMISFTGTTETVSSQSGFPFERIWAASDTSIWATSIGTILHSNGSNGWSVVYVSPTVGDTMLGLWGFSSVDVHTLTVNGNVFKWDGTSWTETLHGGTSWRAEWGDQADTNVLCAASQTGTVYCNDIAVNATAGTLQLMSLWGSSNTTLYTTNVNGGIYQSTDSGTTFKAMTSGTTDTLFAIWGSGPTQIWAAGQAGTIITNSGGATWTAQASGTTNDLRWLWAGTAPTGYTGDAYAVGDAGTIQHFNGTQWSPMWSGVTTTLRTVYGISPTNVYVGGDNGVVLIGSQ